MPAKCKPTPVWRETLVAISRQFPQGCGATPIETIVFCTVGFAQCKERHHPQPTPPHHPSSCVACHMCASAKNVIIPNPPHPTTPAVAYHVTCVQVQRTSSSPTHPTPPPQQLRSMSHVCKCKERHHPQPTPPHHPGSCVACHMGASTKNVITPASVLWENTVGPRHGTSN